MKSMQKTSASRTCDPFVVLPTVASRAPAAVIAAEAELKLPNQLAKNEAFKITRNANSGSDRNNTKDTSRRRVGKCIERSSSFVGLLDRAADNGAIATQCGSASLHSLSSLSGSTTSSSFATASLSSGSNWMVARFRGPPLVTSASSSRCRFQQQQPELLRDLDGRGGGGGSSNRSKSEGIAACSKSTHGGADASEINISYSASCSNQISFHNSNNNNNNNHIDVCCCAMEDTERATDCCNQQQSSDSNQFNTCHKLPCLPKRHKHSSVCAKREIIAPSGAASAINNTVAYADRWQANSIVIEHDVDSRCLAANYDTKPLLCFHQGYAPQINRVTKNNDANQQDDSNNNNKDNANSSSISDWQARSVTIPEPADQISDHQLAACINPGLLAFTSQKTSSDQRQKRHQVVSEPKIEPQPQAVYSPSSKPPLTLESSQRSDETEVADIEEGPVVSTPTLWQLLSQQHSINDNKQPAATFDKRQEKEAPQVNQNSEPPEVAVVGGRQQQRQQDQHQLQQQQEADTNPALSSEVMEILRYPNNNEDRLKTFQTYPNNTLLVDLSKCHRNITHLLPHPTHISGNKTLGSCSIKNCWPPPILCSTQAPRAHSATGSRRRKRKKFNYHMPEPLLRTTVTLKEEDYNRALNVLSSDVRYQLHLLLYRRVQTIWLLLSTILCVLVPVLLANLEILMIVGACFLWLSLQIVGAFVTTQFRKKLDEMLEKSVAQVNSYFMEHNLMLGVINVGSLLSKAKLIIPMLYFDTSQCREQIESIISIDSRNDADGNNESILDYTRIDLPLTKPNVMALAQSQLAKKIILRYSQRWISYFDKRKLMFTDDRIRPRHLSTGKCLCQFIEEQFRNNEHLINKQQQEKHNHAIKLKTKITPLSNNEQQQPTDEAHVQPQVLRKLTQMAPSIPTLSRLVSLKESSDYHHVKIDMVKISQQQQKQTNGLAPNSWYLDVVCDEQQDQQPCKAATTSETPVSSPDLSLEMGSDLISRSDELVRKLRLLLELRKNELQSIGDGSLFSSVLYKTPQNMVIPGDSRPDVGSDNSDTYRFEVKVEDTRTNNLKSNTKTNEGKRFYTQREGLFFSNIAKKIQQDTNTTNNRVLEIC